MISLKGDNTNSSTNQMVGWAVILITYVAWSISGKIVEILTGQGPVFFALFVNIIRNVFLLLGVMIGSDIVKTGRFRQVVLDEIDAVHDEKLIFYLRPFRTDGEAPYGSRTWGDSRYSIVSTYEQDIQLVVAQLGCTVAVADPERKSQVPGASYLRSSPFWQNDVEAKIADSELVIIRIGLSDGILWELEKAMQIQPPHNLLLFIPARQSLDFRDFLYQALVPARFASESPEYIRFREQVRGQFSQPLPKVHGQSSFIGFKEDWTPVAFVPKRSLFDRICWSPVQEALTNALIRRDETFEPSVFLGRRLLGLFLTFVFYAIVIQTVHLTITLFGHLYALAH